MRGLGVQEVHGGHSGVAEGGAVVNQEVVVRLCVFLVQLVGVFYV